MSPKTAPVATARGQLSRETLVERALEMADAEGLDAVTIRRLAQDFGVTPMALYWHFRNKDELFAALADRVLADVRVVPDDGTAWDERLHVILTALVTALRAHPAIATLAAGRILLSVDGVALTEQTLALLREIGFDLEQAATIAHHALLTALVLVTGEPGAEGQVSAAEREHRHAAKTASIRNLDPHRYPNVIASIGAFMACRDEQSYYDTGVELFVAGVRGLREAAASGRTDVQWHNRQL